MRALLTLVVRAVLLTLAIALPAWAGPSFTTPPETVEVASWSPRMPDHWTSLEGVGFTIHGPLRDLALLQELSEHGDEALPRLAKDLGLPLGGDVDVYVASTTEEFRALQPGAPPVWADGTAWPRIGAVFLRHPDARGGMARPLEQVLDHELVHVILGRAFAPERPPRWLQEGVAQVYSGEAGPELTARISRGLMGGQPFRLEELAHRFPAGAHRADLAYAQSADFIQWFQQRWGDDAVRQLVLRSRRGEGIAAAILGITGQSLDEVDDAWHARLVATTPVWTAPENLEALLWAGAGGLILVGGFLRRRAFRRRMRDWADEEQALDRLAREVLSQRQDRRLPTFAR